MKNVSINTTQRCTNLLQFVAVWTAALNVEKNRLKGTCLNFPCANLEMTLKNTAIAHTHTTQFLSVFSRFLCFFRSFHLWICPKIATQFAKAKNCSESTLRWALAQGRSRNCWYFVPLAFSGLNAAATCSQSFPCISESCMGHHGIIMNSIDRWMDGSIDR